MIRTLLAVSVAALVFVLPASAGNLPPAGSGTLSINAAESVLALGGSVEFYADWPGHLQNPRVQVLAYQDVDIDGDGDIDPHSLTYGEAGGVDHVFELGGNPDRGSLWRIFGGPAICHADLFYFKTGNHEWSGSGQQEVVYLASLDFSATG